MAISIIINKLYIYSGSAKCMRDYLPTILDMNHGRKQSEVDPT